MKITFEFDTGDLTKERLLRICELFAEPRSVHIPEPADEKAMAGPMVWAGPAETVMVGTEVVGDSVMQNFSPPRRGRGRPPKVVEPTPAPEPVEVEMPGSDDVGEALTLATAFGGVDAALDRVLELTERADPAAISPDDAELVAAPEIPVRELGIACAEAQAKYAGTPRGETIASELMALIGQYVPAGKHYNVMPPASRPAFLEKVKAL